MTFITGALIVVVASFIAVWLNDLIPGGDLPDSLLENNDQSSDDAAGH